MRAPRYYVPLSILRKWPPLDRLDLLGEDGRPIPFLTGRQNRILDAAVLVQMAEDLTTEEPLSREQIETIANIAIGRGKVALDAFQAVCPTFDELDPGAAPATVEALRADRAFVVLARKLCGQTLLWLRTEGHPDDREIVKFAYDMPFEISTGEIDLASFGLAPFGVDFETPHVGTNGSYHLSVSVPPQLRIVDPELVLFEEGGVNADGADVRFRVTPDQPVRPSFEEFEAYAEVHGSRAKFYVSGTREGLAGRVYVGLRTRTDGFVRSASLGAFFMALAIAGFAAVAKNVSSTPDPAVAVLLVVPALMIYVLRPLERVLVGGLLANLRRLAILAGLWPLIAAALVICVSSASVLTALLAAAAGLEAATSAVIASPMIVDAVRRRKAESGATKP